MKQLLILLVVFTITSCTNNTNELLLRVHNLESQLDSLSSERDSLSNQIVSLISKRDSLLNVEYNRKHYRVSKYYAETYDDTVALRWSYGTGAFLWRGSLSTEKYLWEEHVSFYQLWYDWELLNEEESLKSDNSNFTPHRNFHDIYESLTKKVFVVNTHFEVERFDYYLSTEITNAISARIFSLAKKKVSGHDDLNEDEKYMMITAYAGLCYRAMYRSIRESYIEAIVEEFLSNYKIN